MAPKHRVSLFQMKLSENQNVFAVVNFNNKKKFLSKSINLDLNTKTTLCDNFTIFIQQPHYSLALPQSCMGKKQACFKGLGDMAKK